MARCFGQCSLGHGLKYFLFSPLLGEDSHFDHYFSTGSKPPTSHWDHDSMIPSSRPRSPESGWLEDDFPFGFRPIFTGELLVLGEGVCCKVLFF